MIQDTTRFTMDLPTALSRTLSGNVKPMITQCSMRHLYTLPQSEHPQKETMIALAKNMERRRCNHHTLENPLSTLECLSSVIDPKSTHTDKDLINKFNYVVAVQDEDVRRWCRRVKGVPIIYVKRSVMVMEPMGERSVGVREGMEKGKMRSGLRARERGEAVEKRKRGDEDEEIKEVGGVGQGGGTGEREGKKRKKGPKGPNPLSVKKPKKSEKKVTGNDTPRRDEELNPAVGQPEERDLESEKAGGDAGLAMSEAQKPPTARKRKRKHRSKKLEELATVPDGGEEEIA